MALKNPFSVCLPPLLSLAFLGTACSVHAMGEDSPVALAPDALPAATVTAVGTDSSSAILQAWQTYGKVLRNPSLTIYLKAFWPAYVHAWKTGEEVRNHKEVIKTEEYWFTTTYSKDLAKFHRGVYANALNHILKLGEKRLLPFIRLFDNHLLVAPMEEKEISYFYDFNNMKRLGTFLEQTRLALKLEGETVESLLEYTKAWAHPALFQIALMGTTSLKGLDISGLFATAEEADTPEKAALGLKSLAPLTDLSQTRLECRVLPTGLNLKDLNFSQSGWHKVTGQNTNLQKATFSEVFFKNCRLEKLKAQGALFFKAQFRKCTFPEGAFTGASFKNASLENVNFIGASLTGANFKYARFENVNFAEASLTGANFKYATLENVDFTRSSLTAANFKYAKFQPQIKELGDVTGADFTGSVMGGPLKSWLLTRPYVSTLKGLENTRTRAPMVGPGPEEKKKA